MGAAGKGNRMWEARAVEVTGRLVIAWRWRTARAFSESLGRLSHCETDGLSAFGNLSLRQFAKIELRTEAFHSERLPTEAWVAVCEISG